MVRKPCVAGAFYPGEPEALKDEVARFLVPPAEFEGAGRTKARALIAPHAGYVYSGHVAGAVYSVAEIPDNVILLGPNHTGMGAAVSVMAQGSWVLPSGTSGINERLAGLILQSSPLFTEDMAAHLREHSLEVQLPFIQAVNPGAEIVPITVMDAGTEEIREMGESLARVIAGFGPDVLLAVSSDMNHYEPDDETRRKDRMAIDMVTALDPVGLLEVTGTEGITMCGVLPAAIALTAAKALGAERARLVKYATSGDTSGDYSQVVGYAGFIIE